MHDLRKDLGVLEHRARTEHIVVPGPVSTVCLEDRLLEALEERLVVDVRIRVVDEDAGLDIAASGDVAEDAAARNAATDELAVILEVHCHDRLAALVVTHLADAVQHVLALLERRHEVGIGTLAHRHVVEVPCPERALLDDEVVVLIGSDRLDVVPCVGRGDAEGKAVLAHEVHGSHDLVEAAIATAAVVGILEALEGEREYDVAEALDVVADLLGHERAVREEAEDAVIVLLCELCDILPADHRLAACHHEEVAAKLLCLGDDLVHIVEGKVQRLRVVSSPAADAMHVAGARRIEDDDPGHIALILLGRLRRLAQTAECCLIGAIERGGLEDVRIETVGKPDQEVFPLGAWIESLPERNCHIRCGVGKKLHAHIEELLDSLLGVVALDALYCRIEGKAECLALCSMCQLRLHGHAHPFLPRASPLR